MIQSAAFPMIQQPQSYIGSKETTLRKNILEKVAIFGILLGSGLLLLSLYTTTPLIIGAVVTALSAYAFHYLSNIDSSHALANAAEASNRCMLNFLLLLGANPNENSRRSPLHVAAARGYSGIIRDLLNAGANPNIADGYNRTPLHEAVTSHQDDAVEILLKHGADPQIREKGISLTDGPIEWSLRNQQFFLNRPNEDHCIVGDQRTRDERKAATDRIVELLRPYMRDPEAQPLLPN